MAILRETPYGNFNFLVDLGTGETDSPQAGFSEVILPRVSVEVIEYRTGGSKTTESRKLPGANHSDSLTLKRGLTGALDLYEWWNQIRNGDVINARRNVTIFLQNEDRSENVFTWKFLHAWPSSYAVSPLDAVNQEILIETIELTFDRLEIE